MNQPILELRDFQINRGGMQVIDLPFLSIEAGEFLSLIGPNGTGKSTLLLAMSFLLKPVRGSLFFQGREIRNHQSVMNYRRHIGMVFQESLLFDTTVFDNVASGLKIRGMTKKERIPLVEEYLDRFGISHLAHRSARKLSGGEAQRTSLARAFATRPEVIFLDEPFSSLDPPTKESLINDLDRILKEMKTTAIMATHDQSKALRLSERIAVMREGKIIQIGTPAKVMNHPSDEFVASFVGVETILDGTVKENHAGSIVVDISGHTIEAVGEVSRGSRVTCCIRPEHITLTKCPADVISSARNALKGRIEAIQSMGLFYKIQLDCGFYLVAYVTRTSLEELCLKEGTEVVAFFKATAVHINRTAD